MAGEKILIVDTEKNVLLTYKAFLEEEGYQVDIATSIDEALEKIASGPYAVLVTELYLKRSHTLNLIKDLHRGRPEVYIIMITANLLSPTAYAEVLEAGVQDCFSKPFSTKNLLAHIKKGLKTRTCYAEKKHLEEKILILEEFFSNQETMFCDAHYFMKVLRQEQRRSERYNHSFSLIAIEINSSEEDSTGDQSNVYNTVLDEITPVLLSNLRHTDYITRFKGRYSLILPETSRIASINLSKRLEDKIKSLPLRKDYAQYTSLADRMTFTTTTYPDDSEKIDGWINHFEQQLDTATTDTAES